MAATGLTPPAGRERLKVGAATRKAEQDRALSRHPATSRLWRRYLQQRKQPPTLLQKAMASWKLFLMTEAYADPLAMALIMAHKEALDTFLGPSPKRSKTPTRNVPKSMEPLVGAWAGRAAETTEQQAPAARPAAEALVNRAGNQVLPRRDRDELIVGLKIITVKRQQSAWA